jgi:hypothetical protein
MRHPISIDTRTGRQPRRQWISGLAALAAGILIAATGLQAPAYAASTERTVIVENRTYSPMWYRYRGQSGVWSHWGAMLPGGRHRYTNRAAVPVEVRLESGGKRYTLHGGQTYYYSRSAFRASPRLVHDTRDKGRGNWRRPTPPQAGEFGVIRYASSSHAFQPLNRFIDRCDQRGDEYRLSLKQLAIDCYLAQQRGKLPERLRYVRGFTWFFGYVVDTQNDDVVLLGVKDPTRPAIELDCLVTAIKAIHEGRVPACSLDEHPDPRYQKSVIRGVPWRTKWADIMIYADYDMKKLGQGHFDPRIAGFQSRFDRELEDGRRNHRLWKVGNTSSRYWFKFDSDVPRSVVSTSGDMVVLYRNPVNIGTEQEVAGRYGTGATLPYAVRFTQDFNRHIDTLRKHYPTISQLQAIFRLYDLAFHLRHVSKATPPAMRYWLELYDPPYPGPPSGLPTLSRTKVVNDVTGKYKLTSQVKGGVLMRLDVGATASQVAPVQDATLRRIRQQ